MKKLLALFLILAMLFSITAYADTPSSQPSAYSFLKGDVNGDDLVDAADLALLKKVISKLVSISDSNVKNPNVDGSGSEPDAADLALLKKIIAKLVVEEDENSLVTKEQLRQIEKGFLTLVNYERERVGARPLNMNSHLDHVAQIRSVEIIDTWSHMRPDGTFYFSAINESIYPYITCGENICMTSHVGDGYYSPSDRWVGSPAQIEAAYSWLFLLFKNSPGHYSNMINSNFEDCGIGISYIEYTDGLPMFYLAHIFGTK